MAHDLLFKRITILMVISMILGANMRLNNIPAVDGVSDTLSQTTIVVGCPGPDYYVIARIYFGTYDQVNNEPNPANNLI